MTFTLGLWLTTTWCGDLWFRDVVALEFVSLTLIGGRFTFVGCRFQRIERGLFLLQIEVDDFNLVEWGEAEILLGFRAFPIDVPRQSLESFSEVRSGLVAEQFAGGLEQTGAGQDDG